MARRLPPLLGRKFWAPRRRARGHEGRGKAEGSRAGKAQGSSEEGEVTMDARVTKTLKITTPSDLEIAMTREFDAARHLVFDAMTKPEHVRRWLGCVENPMIA